MTQIITPNHDPRYTVIIIERGSLGHPHSLVEEPVTAWLHQLGPGASVPSQQPLHPSVGMDGDRYLKRPAGKLVNVATGGTISLSSLITKCRLEGLHSKDAKVLDRAAWGGVLDVLNED